MLGWPKEIWVEFLDEIVKNEFTGSGFKFEEGLNYNMGMESDYEIDLTDEPNNRDRGEHFISCTMI